jgi:hypothetical protein
MKLMYIHVMKRMYIHTCYEKDEHTCYEINAHTCFEMDEHTCYEKDVMDVNIVPVNKVVDEKIIFGKRGEPPPHTHKKKILDFHVPRPALQS